MKRLFISAILVSLCLACSSCNTKSPVNATESSESEPTDASTYTETAKATDSAEPTSESISEQITEPTTALSSKLSVTTPDPATTTAETSAVVLGPMVGAVDKPPAYELLQNEAGNYTGVRFTYADGDTYTWECPVESVLPPIVIFDFEDRYFAGTCLIEYATAEDQVDLENDEIIYRHKNA